MATYSIDDLSRREILRMSAVLGIASAASTRFASAQMAGRRTPEQILGPFYPLNTLGQNADLTKVPGRPGRAAGLVLNVVGQVLDLRGGKLSQPTSEMEPQSKLVVLNIVLNAG